MSLSPSAPSRKAVPHYCEFTQGTFIKLFDFNRYASQTISEKDYMDFLRYFLKPKIREIIFRQFERPDDIQHSKRFNWDRFNMEVTATFPLFRDQPEWLLAVRKYVAWYLTDHRSKKLKTFQSQTIVNMDSLSSLQHIVFGTNAEVLRDSPKVTASSTNQDDPCEHQGKTPTSSICATEELDDVTQFLMQACMPLPCLQPTFDLLGVRTSRHLAYIASWKDEEIRDALELCARKNLIQTKHIEILFNAFRKMYGTHLPEA